MGRNWMLVPESSSRRPRMRDAIWFVAAVMLVPLPAGAQQEASCLAPSLEVDVTSATLRSDAGGSLSTVLHVQDPNPAQVSGYNLYRSPEPFLPQGSWALLAVDAVDEDAVMPGIQLSDTSGAASPTGAFYYVVAAYNGPCAAEGPWHISPTGDFDGDGVGSADDPCPTTPEGVIPLMTGCSATDLLLRPEVLVGPIDEGIAAFLAENVDFTPDEVLPSLTSARVALASAFDDLRDATPCPASSSFGTAVGHMNDALLGVEAYLDQLAAGGAGGPTPPAEGASNVDGPMPPASPEELYWRGQHFVLSTLIGEAGGASEVADQVCASEGASTTIQGRVRSISDDERLVVLQGGERILMAWTASQQGEERMAEKADVAVEGRYYGPILVGTIFANAPSPFPLLPGLLYDSCLRLRVLPVQPFPSYPYSQSSWIRHAFDGYLGGGGRLEFEAGTRLMAEDRNCPGILPGAGPLGQDLLLEYYYQITLDYKPKQGGFVTGAVIAHELDGDSYVPLPSMDPATDGTIVATKFKRTCLDSGMTIPIINQYGDTVGSVTLWNCSAEQVVTSDIYPIRVRDVHEYCAATYSNTIFDIEDHQPADWRPTQVQSVTVLPGEVPLPVTFSATGDKIVGGNPIHDQVVGLNESFAIYNPFGHFHWGYGTNNRSFLDWPYISGTRNSQPFRYACSVPPLLTDVISTCGGMPSTFYRLPYPPNFTTTVNQGNGGSFTHAGWQFFALDLSGDQDDEGPLRAARGGKVVKVRKNMMLNCVNQTCPSFGFPLLDEYGNHVAIQHQDGTVGWYAHMVPNSSPVFLNQNIKRGAYIGQIGNTGNSTGPHLHFHVTPQNPSMWGNTTILARYEFNLLTLQTQTCMVPQQGSSYRSTNGP